MCWQIHHALGGAAGVAIARGNPARLRRETPRAYPPAFARKAVTAVIPATGKPKRQTDNLKAGFGLRQLARAARCTIGSSFATEFNMLRNIRPLALMAICALAA